MNSEIQIHLGVAKAENFNEVYFDMVDLLSKSDSVDSRNGNVHEILNFKTELSNPIERCVAGRSRDMNVFFLLAEALWIFAGRKDVQFLQIFNSQMKEYSDDGVNFHAPYGYRLRNAGITSFVRNEAKLGFDQIQRALQMAYNDPNDRRIVLQIWNYELDLGTTSKDIPCNDFWMWKIRNGKLHTTIGNRSNDINWGLPTNVFQFSFVGEICANILDLKLGNQVHNSQSLHMYTEGKMGELTNKILSNDKRPEVFYGIDIFSREFDFNYASTDVAERLKQIDMVVNVMLTRLTKLFNSEKDYFEERDSVINLIGMSSEYLRDVFLILEIYVNYKVNKNKESALSALRNLRTSSSVEYRWDYLMLAEAFFTKRLNMPESIGYKY